MRKSIVFVILVVAVILPAVVFGAAVRLPNDGMVTGAPVTSTTITIAANDSSAAAKASADFVVPDGATTAADTIYSAIQSIPQPQGGTVRFLVGTYSFPTNSFVYFDGCPQRGWAGDTTDPAHCRTNGAYKNLTFDAEGPGTILQSPGPSASRVIIENLVGVRSEGYTIQGFTFDNLWLQMGSPVNSQQSLFSAPPYSLVSESRINNVLVQGNNFTNRRAGGATITPWDYQNGSVKLIADNLIFRDNTLQAPVTANGIDLFQLGDSVMLANNTFFAGAPIGGAGGTILLEGNDLTITGNTIQGPSGAAGGIALGWLHTVGTPTLVAGAQQRIDVSSGNAFRCPACAASSAGLLSLYYVDDVTVDGNSFERANLRTIGSAAYPARNVTVNGQTVTDGFLSLSGGSTGSNFSITNNTVTHTGVYSLTYGGFFTNLYNSVVSGNTMNSTRRAGFQMTTVVDSTIDGNMVIGAGTLGDALYDAFYINGSNNQIVNNFARYQLPNRSGYGLRLLGSGNFLSGNDFRDSGVDWTGAPRNFVNSGTGTILGLGNQF